MTDNPTNPKSGTPVSTDGCPGLAAAGGKIFGESPIKRPLTGRHPPARADSDTPQESEKLAQALRQRRGPAERDYGHRARGQRAGAAGADHQHGRRACRGSTAAATRACAVPAGYCHAPDRPPRRMRRAKVHFQKLRRQENERGNRFRRPTPHRRSF